MPDPLALIPLAAAARGGSIDGLDARQLVAAGLTMLQRCAPLVRALAPGRGAVLLPNSAAYLVALAACEGRGAVLLDPDGAPKDVARGIEDSGARVVFTVKQYVAAIPERVPRVLLDELPGHAELVQLAERRRVDLGSHFGFAIEGEGDIEGRDEEAVVVHDGRAAGGYTSFTHRELLNAGRAMVDFAQLAGSDSVLALLPFHRPAGLAASLLAPLLAGARVTTLQQLESARVDGTAAVDALERDGITAVVGDAEQFAMVTSALRQMGRTLDAPTLRVAMSGGRAIPAEVRAEWLKATGIEIREVDAPPA